MINILPSQTLMPMISSYLFHIDRELCIIEMELSVYEQEIPMSFICDL